MKKDLTIKAGGREMRLSSEFLDQQKAWDNVGEMANSGIETLAHEYRFKIYRQLYENKDSNFINRILYRK